jgi:RNA polymerase sigma factor (sigma-70 family)
MPHRRAYLGTPTRQALALALIAAHDRAFRRTARRHSICADDAEDAYQRALEILLTKTPTDQPPRLAAWMHTVTKHEAMAVRRERERMLGGSARAASAGAEAALDAVPSDRVGPPERAERRERVVHSAEALAALKPQERRTLALKAEGYSYAEIGAITGFSYTKVNRCMAEGRKGFLELFARIEDGSRCDELAGALGALGSGAALNGEVDALRRHLLGCGRCRRVARARLTG